MTETTNEKPATKADPKTYQGGCHCGQVRYEVTTALDGAMACNCSICSMKGALLTFVPPDRFELISGQAQLSDYQFNKMVIHHLFCAICGVQSYATGVGPDGKQMYAINVRCLDGVDCSALPLSHFDGKSL
jgi:hypothetical protein